MLFAEQLAARAAEKQRSIATPIIDDNDCNLEEESDKIKQPQLDESDTNDILSNKSEELLQILHTTNNNTNIPPSGEDREYKIESSDTNSNNSKNAFDLQTFNQLRIERLENQRRAEERKWKASRGLLRRGNTTISESLPDSSQSSSFDITEREKISARQELLHLGRRYATQQSSSLVLSLIQKEGDQFIPNSDANFILESRSSLPALELLSPQSNSGNSVVTPDKKIIPKEKDSGVYSYLLLARTPQEIRHQHDNVLDEEERSASPAPYLQASSACNSHNEDGSSCEDHQSLDDNQQSRDGILDHFTSFVKAQVFISEIEGNINSSSKQNDVASLCTSETDSQIVGIMKSNNIKEWRMRARVRAIIQLLFVTFVIAATCYGLRYVISWYMLSFSEWSPKLSTQYHSLLYTLRCSYWSANAMLNVLNSKLVRILSKGTILWDDAASRFSSLWERASSSLTRLWNAVIPVYIKYQTNVIKVLSQIISICKHTASQLIFWVNQFGKWQDNNRKFVLGLPNLIHSSILTMLEQTSLLWQHSVSSLRLWMQSIVNKPYEAYAVWRQNFDMLSWTIGNVYRFEKAYYDIVELFSAAKDRLVEVRESSILALNMTLSTAVSLWQDMSCEEDTISTLTLQDDDRMIRRLSLTTVPLVFWSSNEHISKHSNETTSSLINEVEATTQEEEIVAPQFWKSGNSRGTPFVKYQSRHRLGSRMIPPLDLEHWNQNGISYPLVLLRHPHLSLNHPHFLGSDGDDNDEHILHSSMALSTVEIQQETQTPTTPVEHKNYYAASYPVEGQSHDRDIFNEVDVLAMARDFVSKILEQRRSSNQEQSS